MLYACRGLVAALLREEKFSKRGVVFCWCCHGFMRVVDVGDARICAGAMRGGCVGGERVLLARGFAS